MITIPNRHSITQSSDLEHRLLPNRALYDLERLGSGITRSTYGGGFTGNLPSVVSSTLLSGGPLPPIAEDQP